MEAPIAVSTATTVGPLSGPPPATKATAGGWLSCCFFLELLLSSLLLLFDAEAQEEELLSLSPLSSLAIACGSHRTLVGLAGRPFHQSAALKAGEEGEGEEREEGEIRKIRRVPSPQATAATEGDLEVDLEEPAEPEGVASGSRSRS